jgi:sterol desaturase/sphingolipid hydroxylase (fatty acid hydroxylase superfamily)
MVRRLRVASVLIFPLFVTAITLAAVGGATVVGVGNGGVALGAYVAWLTVVYVAVAMLERWFPYRAEWNRDAGDVRADVTHLFVTGTVASQGGLAIAAGLVWAFGGPRAGGLWPVWWPMVAQLGLALVIAELGHYAFHRLTHEHALFWRLHAVHHSAPRLYWLNATRFHPLDLLGLTVGQTLPLLALGITPEAFFAYAVFSGSYGQVQHGNVALDSGPLRWLLSTPELHRWHHSVEPHEGNTNYGAILSVWDRLLGTYFWPRDRAFTGTLGVSGMPAFPRAYGAHLLAPFRWRTVTRDAAQVSTATGNRAR